MSTRALVKCAERPFDVCYLLTSRKRFMMVPRTTMEKDLKNQEKALTDDINSLNKKVTFLLHLTFQ